jgi:hypothetical protein
MCCDPRGGSTLSVAAGRNDYPRAIGEAHFKGIECLRCLGDTLIFFLHGFASFRPKTNFGRNQPRTHVRFREITDPLRSLVVDVPDLAGASAPRTNEK